MSTKPVLPLLLLASATLGACNDDPTPEAVAPQDETEAGVLADDAVSLAENAMEDAARSDAPPARPDDTRPASAPPPPDVSNTAASEVEPESDTNTTSAD